MLIVDDDDDQRFLLARLFDRHGTYAVHQASDGAEAVAMARDHQPDLVVLDVAMPGLSGIDVLPQIIEAAPGSRTVMLSNLPRIRNHARSQLAGAAGYLEKSTPSSVLVDELLLTAALVEAASTAVVATELFPPELTTPAAARRFVVDSLESAGASVAESVAIVVSELATNVVLHAGSGARVDVRVGAAVIRVEVYDTDPHLPSPAAPRPGDPTGRGLLLVDALTDRWGSEAAAGGKVVWFEIDR